jgi:molybdopterin molybdotransferase
LIAFEEARRKILRRTKVLPTVKKQILDSLDYVLARDIRSRVNIPPFKNSAMDGFAVRFADVREARRRHPVSLEIIDDVPAGKTTKQQVRKGKAIRIMTGAPVPRGADGVVMVENTVVKGDQVKVYAAVSEGENVRLAGEDIRKGERVLKKGTLIRPQEMGILASLGKKEVRVIRRPRVAIISTGDELVSIDQPLAPGKIRDSNKYTLYGQILKAKAEVVDLGMVPDHERKLIRKMKKAVARADVILTTGGVSVGDYDLVKEVLATLGQVVFWRVKIKPGKPLLFGSVNGKLLFGLPGNPVSSMVVFDQFVRPSLLKMAGRKKLFRNKKAAIAQDVIRKKLGRREFVRGRLRFEEGKWLASVAGPQGSGILKSMSLADGLIVLREEEGEIKRKDRVWVEFFDDPERE